MNKSKKSYYVFENSGEVNKDIIKLIGLSTKRDDSTKIGQWGSGLKYAIATFVREGIEIKLFSGENEVKIGKKKKKIPGYGDVDVITFNSAETSMTTDMGFDWKIWYAIREVYSNMIDEGGKNITIDNSPNGKKGTTRFFVEMGSLTDIDMDKYFLASSSPIESVKYRNEKIDVYDNPYGHFMVYYKGILCFEDEDYKSKYRYSSDKIEINESRVAKYSFAASELIGKAFITSGRRDVVDSIMNVFSKNGDGKNMEMFDSCWEVSSHEITDKAKESIQRILKNNVVVSRSEAPVRKRAQRVDYVIPTTMYELLQDANLIPKHDEEGDTYWKNVTMVTPDDSMFKIFNEVNNKVFKGKSEVTIAIADESLEYKKVHGTVFSAVSEQDNKRIILNREFIDVASDTEIKKELILRMCAQESDSQVLTASFERALVDKIYSMKYDA